MTSKELKAVPLVDIDKKGLFKYVLIKITGSGDCGETEKKIVRGYTDCEYHADIFERVMNICKKSGLDCQCLGGGRIMHNPNKKYIKIYSYSQAFGKADHLEAKRILETEYEDYEIETTDEVY